MITNRTLFALLAVTACEHDSSVGHDQPDAQSSTSGDAKAADAATSQPPAVCTGTTKFAMNGPMASQHHETSETPAFMYGGDADQIVGAFGALAGGMFFSMRRDGDFSDGHLETVTSYDVSQYPYNILFSTAPVAHEGCEGTPSCSDWVAVAGTYTVTQVMPVYRGTFTLSMLREGDSPSGTPIPGSVAGCFAIPNP